MANFMAVAGSYEGGLYGWCSKEDSLSLSSSSSSAASSSAASSSSSSSASAVTGELELIFGFGAHIGAIKAVAIDGDGKILATGGVDEYIKLFDVQTRRERGELAQHTGSVLALQFFRSSHLLSASQDGTVCIWRASDWLCLHVLGGHKDAVTSVTIHPSGRMALSAARDRTLRLWNLVEGRCAYITKPPVPRHADIEKVSWSPAGVRYALVAAGTLQIYDAGQVGKPTPSFTHQQRPRINDLVFAQEASIVIGSDDGSLQVVDAAAGSLLQRLDLKSILSGRIKSMGLCRTPARRGAAADDSPNPLVVTSSSSGKLHLWDVFGTDAGGTPSPLATASVPGAASRLTCLATCWVPAAAAGVVEVKPASDSKPGKKRKATAASSGEEEGDGAGAATVADEKETAVEVRSSAPKPRGKKAGKRKTR